MDIARITTAWKGRKLLAPRQAAALATTLDVWAEMEIPEWLAARDYPLQDLRPFDVLDPQIMTIVNGDAVWVAKAAERLHAVAAEIRRGVWPPDRAGCFGDEVFCGAALVEAPTMLRENPELFATIPALPGDDDWSAAQWEFDDRARFEEYFVPLHRDHRNLGLVLEAHPPATWFNPPR